MTEIITDKTQGNPFAGDAKPKKITVRELANSVAGLESRIEALGKNSELSSETVGYVQQLRSEEKWNWWIRLACVVAFGSFLFSLWWHLLYLIIDQPTSLFLIGENARVALIAGISVMTTFFIVTVLRGIYRIASDRHSQKLPEHLEMVVRAIGENS